MAWWDDQSQVIKLELLAAFFWLLLNEEKLKNVCSRCATRKGIYHRLTITNQKMLAHLKIVNIRI